MIRRDFLVNSLLWILAFFFGYTIKRESENLNFSASKIGKSIDSYSGANDLTKFNNAIADLNANGGVLKLTPGKTYNIAGALSPINVSKMTIEGKGTFLQFSNIGKGVNAITLYSSTTYSNRFKNNVIALNGVIVLGGDAVSPLAGNGIFIGHKTYQENALFTIENGGVQGFTNNILFGNNAWRIKFNNFSCQWGNINVPTGLINFGENMIFNNCMINDGATQIIIGSGEFHFENCSIDNVSLRIIGEAQVYINGGHLENPANNSSYRYISIEHVDGSVFLNNTAVIYNSTSPAFNQCLFYVEDGNTNQGLIMNNLKLFQSSAYQPYSGKDAVQALVAGKGRAILKGMASWRNYSGFVISRSMNKLFNGDFESGTTGWINTNGTFTVDTSTKKIGTQSGHMNAGVGVNETLTQSFFCEPNQWVSAQFWFKSNIPTDGHCKWQVDFYNRDGVKTGSVGYTDLTASNTSWTNSAVICGVVPVGSSYGILTFACVGGTSAASDVWIDDVILNIV